jgi:hypothetical protein
VTYRLKDATSDEFPSEAYVAGVIAGDVAPSTSPSTPDVAIGRSSVVDDANAARPAINIIAITATMPERTTSARERRPRLPSRARRSSTIASARASDPVVQPPARRVRTTTTTTRTLTRAFAHQKPTHASTLRVANSKFAHPTPNRRSDDPTIQRVPHARQHARTHARAFDTTARARTYDQRARRCVA